MGAHDGRTALVTGGALGIGQGIVRGFIAEGASVVVRRYQAVRLPMP